MPSAPANPFTQLSQRANAPIVRLGNLGGEAPTSLDETKVLQVISISRSAGGARLDHCDLDYSLAIAEEQLRDIETPAGYNRLVEVRESVDGDDDSGLMFRGALGIQRATLGTSETASMQARVEPWHFGDPLKGIKVWQPGTVVTHHLPIVFNPEIDGQIVFNMSSIAFPGAEAKLWIDPESVRTTGARAEIGQTASEWTLFDVVRTLCQACNPDETFIKNFVLDALESILTTAPKVKNLELKAGQYLPALLDAVLEPHGFGWFLKMALEDAEPVVQMVAFKRNSGVSKEVFFQVPGENLDLAKTNVSNLDLEWNIADLANVVTVHGSLIEREITIELVKGWKESEDALDQDLLGADGEHPNAWRLWVANEAGDYTNSRPEITTVPDFTDVLGADISTKRRPLKDPLTYAFDADTTKHERMEHVRVDWWHAAKEGGAGWESVAKLNDEGKAANEGFAFKVDQTQLAILFNEPPPALVALSGSPASARVRVTGTIVGDTRIEGTATRRSTSPNGNDIELVIDAHERFHDRDVQDSGTYLSIFSSGGDEPATNGADTRDDQTAITEYAEKVRNVEESARISVSVSLHGWHPEYEIGDLITRVDGRNISFNQNSPRNATKRYLQITGIVWNQEAQETILQLETYADIDIKQEQ